MFKVIDRSSAIARLIASVSDFIAKRRGLPIVIGVLLVCVSFALQVVDIYTDSQLITLSAVITLNVGILTALLGLMLAQPLGK